VEETCHAGWQVFLFLLVSAFGTELATWCGPDRQSRGISWGTRRGWLACRFGGMGAGGRGSGLCTKQVLSFSNYCERVSYDCCIPSHRVEARAWPRVPAPARPPGGPRRGVEEPGAHVKAFGLKNRSISLSPRGGVGQEIHAARRVRQTSRLSSGCLATGVCCSATSAYAKGKCSPRLEGSGW
jgi:hypothetical protein